MRTVSCPPCHSRAVPLCVKEPIRSSLLGETRICIDRQGKGFRNAMLGSVARQGQQVWQLYTCGGFLQHSCDHPCGPGLPGSGLPRRHPAAAVEGGSGDGHGPGSGATITDVARLAGRRLARDGVQALNGRAGISACTATRVQQAAEQLGYQPNALARGLLSGRSFTVGLITTDSFGRFSIPVVQGVEDALGPGRILVFLCESRDDRLREQHYLQALLERRVDGIIVTGRRQDRREPIGRDLRVPVVYAMAYSSDPEDLSLVPDDEDGGAQAIRHLLSTGRTTIGHVTGPSRFRAAVLRAAGAEQAFAAAGLNLAGGGTVWRVDRGMGTPRR